MSVENVEDATSVLFTPVSTGVGLADVVAQRIAEAITTGVIADGDQLPSEDRLAAQLGVSTVTLRNALLLLRQQGLVVTKRGRGGGELRSRTCGRS